MSVIGRWKNSLFTLPLCESLPFHPISGNIFGEPAGCLCLTVPVTYPIPPLCGSPADCLAFHSQVQLCQMHVFTSDTTFIVPGDTDKIWRAYAFAIGGGGGGGQGDWASIGSAAGGSGGGCGVVCGPVRGGTSLTIVVGQGGAGGSGAGNATLNRGAVGADGTSSYITGGPSGPWYVEGGGGGGGSSLAIGDAGGRQVICNGFVSPPNNGYRGGTGISCGTIAPYVGGVGGGGAGPNGDGGDATICVPGANAFGGGSGGASGDPPTAGGFPGGGGGGGDSHFAPVEGTPGADGADGVVYLYLGDIACA